jgi:hypothetical protein
METIEKTSSSKNNVTRRSLLRVLGLGAVVTAASAALAGCGGSSSNSTSSGDLAILNAAAIAEALAATMYANIVASPIYTQLGNSGKIYDQGYLVAAYEQEVAHYNLLAVTNGATPVPTNANFYFPTSTFQTAQATLNTLEVVEGLLIAIYLYGVNNLGSSTFRIQFAQILGVESEHRVLGRVVANDLQLSSTTNLSNGQESLGVSDPANNYDYERLFPNEINSLTSITNILTNGFQTVGASGNSQTAYPVTLLTPIATLPGVTAITPDNNLITN